MLPAAAAALAAGALQSDPPLVFFSWCDAGIQCNQNASNCRTDAFVQGECYTTPTGLAKTAWCDAAGVVSVTESRGCGAGARVAGAYSIPASTCLNGEPDFEVDSYYRADCAGALRSPPVPPGVPAGWRGNWSLRAAGPWSSREGLMLAAAPNGTTLWLTGGRDRQGTRFGVTDAWRSDDAGATWRELPAPGWNATAYHAFMELGGCLYKFGGQALDYSNDAWRSCDGGATWAELPAAPWRARAGIAFTTHRGYMIVAGGCWYNSSGGPPPPGPPPRSFLNDVWATQDGVRWERRTPQAAWSVRSGGRLVEMNDRLYMVAGEIGFTPDTQIGDVWSSGDGGRTWQLDTAAPGWSARSGHGVVVAPTAAGPRMLVIAGWPELHDMWSSADGRAWALESTSVWNCGHGKECGKYDFWPLAVGGQVLTFGGSGAYSTFGKLYNGTWATTFNP